MNLRTQLSDKGYDVQTNDRGSGWQCTLEWNGQILTYTGASEAEALRQATKFVQELERRYVEQQARLTCEGCGE